MPRLSLAPRRRLARPVPRLAVAHADPAGKTTLEETLAPAAGSGYSALQLARAARSTSCAAAAPPRRRRSATGQAPLAAVASCSSPTRRSPTR